MYITGFSPDSDIIQGWRLISNIQKEPTSGTRDSIVFPTAVNWPDTRQGLVFTYTTIKTLLEEAEDKPGLTSDSNALEGPRWRLHRPLQQRWGAAAWQWPLFNLFFYHAWNSTWTNIKTGLEEKELDINVRGNCSVTEHRALLPSNLSLLQTKEKQLILGFKLIITQSELVNYRHSLNADRRIESEDQCGKELNW